MRIKAEFFADLRYKMGEASADLSLEGGTIMDLVAALDGRSGGIFLGLMVEGGKPKELVKILVNGKDIRDLNGLETELEDGDVVSFFPPVAGG